MLQSLESLFASFVSVVLPRLLFVSFSRKHALWKAASSSPDLELSACFCRDLWQIGTDFRRGPTVDLQWSSSVDSYRFSRVPRHQVGEECSTVDTQICVSVPSYASCQWVSRSGFRLSQTPSSQADSVLLGSAPGRLHDTVSATI